MLFSSSNNELLIQEIAEMLIDKTDKYDKYFRLTLKVVYRFILELPLVYHLSSNQRGASKQRVSNSYQDRDHSLIYPLFAQ